MIGIAIAYWLIINTIGVSAIVASMCRPNEKPVNKTDEKPKIKTKEDKYPPNYFEDLKNTFKDRCNVVRSNDLQIDINAKGVSKGSAVKTIGKLCGVSVNEIICVGDAGNDIPMLEVAGFPIAVANAQDNVKQICKEVVVDNNNDAIKYIIEKYCI